MTLDDLILTVNSSTADDWHNMQLRTVHKWIQQPNGRLDLIEFSHLAIYKSDVDVSLAYAATICNEFDEPWVRKFVKWPADLVSHALRYRGAVVYEWTGAIVDEGRYLLPLPKPAKAKGKFEVKRADLPMARLFFDLYALRIVPGRVRRTVESVLKEAGIKIVA